MTSSTPAKTLSPCPFCGSNILHYSHPGYGGRVQIICDICGARGGIAKTEPEARRAWNTRTIEKPKKQEKTA